MGIIAFIILGALAGAIAKALLPGDDPGGIIVTTIIGFVGALLGGFLAAAIFDAHPLDEFFDVSTWLTAIVGFDRPAADLPRRGRARRHQSDRSSARRRGADGRAGTCERPSVPSRPRARCT